MTSPAGVAWRLALAHHPLCHYFGDDTWGRRVRVCRGCATLWPLFLLQLPVAVLAVLYTGLGPFQAFGMGAVMGLPQIATAFVRFRPLERVAVKAIGAQGLALLVAGTLLAPVAWPWKAAVAVAVLLGFGLLLAVRARNIVRVCKACPWQMDWEHCPGMVGHEAGATVRGHDGAE